MKTELKSYLYSILSKKQVEEINTALKDGKTIIIKGPSGPTGKTTLKKILQKNGYRSVEEYETYAIILDKPIWRAKNAVD